MIKINSSEYHLANTMNFSIVNFNKLVIYALKIPPPQGFDAPPPLRDSTPCRPKGSPFVLFWDIYIWWRTKNFLKAPSAPINSNKKWLKTAFLACFFFQIWQRRKKFCQNSRIFLVLWKSSENQYVDLKKSTKFSKIWRKKNWKSHPPPPPPPPWRKS